MNEAAFNELVGVIDEAIDLADHAVKAAEEASKQTPEPVTLVKVAAAQCRSAAIDLIKTGSFSDHTVESLTHTLENAGPAEILVLMEKLASKAVFSIDAESVLDGDLVEKSAASRMDAVPQDESNTDLWVRCCDEVGLG